MGTYGSVGFYSFSHSLLGVAAGTDEKVKYLKTLGFDEAINYKTMVSLDDVLRQTCPNGVDIYFDNVSCVACCT